MESPIETAMAVKFIETAHGDQKNPENQSVAHPHFPACPGPCLQDQEEHKDERHESP